MTTIDVVSISDRELTYLTPYSNQSLLVNCFGRMIALLEQIIEIHSSLHIRGLHIAARSTEF